MTIIMKAETNLFKNSIIALSIASAITWVAFVCVWMMPIVHLFQTGHGRSSPVFCLILLPLSAAAASVAIPIKLIRAARLIPGAILTFLSLLLCAAYYLFIATLSAI